jgi:hypothetical protein
MRYNITLGEHCFGTYTHINNKDIFDYQNDINSLNEEVFNIIFSWLKTSFNKIIKDDIEELVEIIHYRNGFELTEEEFNLIYNENIGRLICEKINYNSDVILENLFKYRHNLDGSNYKDIVNLLMIANECEIISSDYESCDQCGNPNYMITYVFDDQL